MYYYMRTELGEDAEPMARKFAAEIGGTVEQCCPGIWAVREPVEDEVEDGR